MLGSVVNSIQYLYKKYVKRDPFLLEVSRWFKDKGDETLRLDYPLTKESVVFDVGGYRGDFAEDINTKYGSRVYIFEPVPDFFDACVSRFQGNPDIICLNYGLSSKSGFLNIGLSDNASSISAPDDKDEMLEIEVKAVTDSMDELNIKHIDLFKINIEGGEFDVLPLLIESKKIERVRFLQIQFHEFIDNAEQKRASIHEMLCLTHSELWSYKFVWESWELKSKNV